MLNCASCVRTAGNRLCGNQNLRFVISRRGIHEYSSLIYGCFSHHVVYQRGIKSTTDQSRNFRGPYTTRASSSKTTSTQRLSTQSRVVSRGESEHHPTTKLNRRPLATAGRLQDSLNTCRHVFVQSRSASTSSISQRARGRSCLVTGATSGIGYAVAKQLVLEGASHVRLVSRDKERAMKTAELIRKETGNRKTILTAVPHDFKESFGHKLFRARTSSDSQPSEDSDANEEATDTQEPPPISIDTLIHCAGVSQSKLLLTTRDDEIQNILRTNIDSTIAITRAFLRHYVRESKNTALKSTRSHASTADSEATASSSSALRSYCMVNISSLLASKGGEGTSVYAASKAAMVAFTRAVALEASMLQQSTLHQNTDGTSQQVHRVPFRANVVCPGYIETPMTEGFRDGHKSELVTQIPLRRFGNAEEVADAVLFLVNNEYANNTVLNLDGGLSAR